MYLSLSKYHNILNEPLYSAIDIIKKSGHDGVINDLHGCKPFVIYTIDDLLQKEIDIWTELQIKYLNIDIKELF